MGGVDRLCSESASRKTQSPPTATIASSEDDHEQQNEQDEAGQCANLGSNDAFPRRRCAWAQGRFGTRVSSISPADQNPQIKPGPLPPRGQSEEPRQCLRGLHLRHGRSTPPSTFRRRPGQPSCGCAATGGRSRGSYARKGAGHGAMRRPARLPAGSDGSCGALRPTGRRSVLPGRMGQASSEPGSAGTSTAYSLSSSSGTVSRARSCVEASTTKAATPAS